MATNQVWPFVRIPDYEAQATAARSILDSPYLAIYPLVTKELRKPYEEFTQEVDNINWVNESFAYQEDFFRTHQRSITVTRQSRRLATQFDIYFDGDEVTIASQPISNNVTFDGTYGSNPHIFRAGVPGNPEDDGDWVNEDEDAPGPL